MESDKGKEGREGSSNRFKLKAVEGIATRCCGGRGDWVRKCRKPNEGGMGTIGPNQYQKWIFHITLL